MATEPYQTWLNDLATGDSEHGAPPPTVEDLLTQLTEGDPRLQALARYLARQANAQAEAEREAEEEWEPTAEQPRADPRRRSELRRAVDRLLAEVAELRERNDHLADALGACYLCWGEDPACPHCRGRGGPGSGPPDRALFATWIAPALRVLRNGHRTAVAARAAPQTIATANSQEEGPHA
jgi:hypothetical protein